MSIKKLLGFSVVGFAVALAVVVGNRMSAEAMAVVIGVVCGVAASIPMSAIVLWLSRRGRPSCADEPVRGARPPVFFFAPPAPAPPVPGWANYGQAYPVPAIAPAREFRIIGDEPL